MKPEVTIIIPTFNRADLIGETLNSVLRQDFHDWECIVVDDGSTDVTIDVVQKFVLTDSRIFLYKRNDSIKGAARCRNIGIEKAQGKYIIFLDSDDLLATYCLSQRLQYIKNTAFDFVVTPMLYFNCQIGDDNRLVNYRSKEDDLTRFLSYDFPWSITGPTWRKQSLKKTDGFDEDSIGGGQDFDLHIKALAKDFNYLVFNDALPDCFYRRHNQGRISSVVSIKKTKAKSRLLLKAIKRLEEAGKLNQLHLHRMAGVYLQQVLLPLAMNDKREFDEHLKVAKNVFNLTKFVITVFEYYILVHKKILRSSPLFDRLLRRILLSITPGSFLPASRNSVRMGEERLKLVCRKNNG
ncbi:MAG: glycosyltransferase family 2 protein [Fulvivirga sp.]